MLPMFRMHSQTVIDCFEHFIILECRKVAVFGDIILYKPDVSEPS